MDWSCGQWTNENIFQMLKLYKQEPCLWDPRTRDYKNRSAHASAWHRILNKLPFKTTLDEAKKKKNSLMGYYRIHLNRYKKTLAITGGRGVYQTTWFAFDLMHSFLSPIYGPKKKKIMTPATTNGNSEPCADIKSEPRSGTESDNPDEMYIDEYKEEFPLEINEEMSLLKPALYPEVNVNEGDPLTNPVNPESNETVLGNETEKKETCDQETNKNITVECLCSKNDVEKKKTGLDEYDHFGFMLASKIRKINSTPDREILMNSIQNLVFETYMKCHNSSNNRETLKEKSESIVK